MFQKFLNKRLKTDETLDVTIYNDGRMHISAIEKPTLTQVSLLRIFKLGMKKGAWNGMNPGQYKFYYATVDKEGADFSLITVEEYRRITQ